MLTVEARAGLREFDLDVRIEVGSRGCTAIAGPSGAGKTSLLRIVAGLAPARGVVRCGGETWLDSDRGIEVPPELRRCGYLFQDYALFGRMRVWQNVAYGLRTPRGEQRGGAQALLDRFGVGHLAEARPGQISGGERQRVALARALAIGPRALLLDEPLSALDASSSRDAARELGDELGRLDVPALMVTHEFEDAALLSDQVAIIEKGKIVQQGPPAEVAARPRSPFVAELTGAILLEGNARPGRNGLTAIDLDEGGTVSSVDPGRGRVTASIHPWEVALEPGDAAGGGSAQNRVGVRVVSLTALGPRVRIGLAAPQPLVAEVTPAAVEQMALAQGSRVTAVWKAAATRIVSGFSGDADDGARLTETQRG